jgi:hypothetical protein
LSQSGERPERYVDDLRFDTLFSKPIRQTWRTLWGRRFGVFVQPQAGCGSLQYRREGCLARGTIGAIENCRRHACDSKCRAAHAQSPPSSSISSAASALTFLTSVGRTADSRTCSYFRQRRRQTCRSRDRLPSRASCRIYILSGSRPPHRLPRLQDRHVHLAHDRYCPCRCDQCAFPDRRSAPPTDHGAAGQFGRC